MRTRLLLAFISSVVLSGCATAMLPQGPDIYSFSRRPGVATLVVAKPEDMRADKSRIGSIGATQYTLKADPTELVAKEMVAALYTENINGVLGQLHSRDSGRYVQEIQNTQADGLLALSIKSVSIKSFDILMDPPTAEVTMEASLYDRQGQLVEKTTVTGQVQRRISAFAYEKAAGELVAEAARDAARRLAGEASLGSSMAKLAKTGEN